MKNPNTCRLKQTMGLEGDEGRGWFHICVVRSGMGERDMLGPVTKAMEKQCFRQ